MSIEKQQEIKMGELFTTSGSNAKAVYVGKKTDKNGNPINFNNLWSYTNGILKDRNNNSFFSGTILTKDQNGESLYSKKDYSLVFDYKPVKAINDVKDDDIIGFIFRAKDQNNFYVLMIESDDMIYYVNNDRNGISYRASDQFGRGSGFNISINPQSSNKCAIVFLR
jgi:hypothetical protein